MLITDPDNLSQGLEDAVADAVFTGSSGANTTITSAGAGLVTLAAGDYFEVRDHSVAGNNGLYTATGSPTSSSLPCTKVDGVNPVDAAAEAIRTLGDNGSAAEYKSVHIDTGQKRIYLIEKGSLSSDGVTLQALYSFLKEEWKADADLIQNAFPVVSITPEQFEFIDGWEPRTVVSPAIRSKKLIRTAGWSEVSVAGIVSAQYVGVVTLGSFEDPANDTGYYQLGTDPTDTAAAVAFTFAGPVNEAVKTLADFGVPTNLAITSNKVITKSGGTSFVTFGFKVGGRVTIASAEDSGNNGSFILTVVAADALTVSGTPLTNNADDDTMRLAADNRNAVNLFLRVRDADPNGKTFDASTVSAIGFSAVDNKAFRFPLANATDLNISETDANIAANEPYTEIRLRYLSASYQRDVDSATDRNYGIIVDVGTHSKQNGASAGTTLFTSAGLSLGAGEALADYAGGLLIIHEGTDQGTWTISGTPVNNAGTLEITLTAPLAGTESNLSFTMQRSTPISASKNEIYEKVQYLLRQAADIDSTSATVTGKTASPLLVFVGADLKCGSLSPTNPNGGGSGVLIEGFDANDTNNLFFYDNSGISRNYPFVAAGTISFNANLFPSDSAPQYWMFFEYAKRVTVTDFAISAASGATGSFDSSGAGLPTVVTNDYVRLTDMTNAANNGIWVVTDASPTASQFDARKVDGATVVNEASASHPLDLKPIDSPQAIVVKGNPYPTGADIAGTIGAASVSFDFDYDNNAQGGRSAGTDAAIVIRAIGLEDAQFAETFGTITRATGLSFSVVSALERNYSNP